MIYTTLTLTVINITVSAFSLYINNFFANQRERRKETRTRLDEIVRLINKMEEDAINFHTSEAFNPLKHQDLIWSLSRLNKSVQRIPYFRRQNDIDIAIKNLRQSISSFNDSESSFLKQEAFGENNSPIHLAKEDLHSKLEEVFSFNFPVVIRSRIGKLFGN